MTEETQKPEAAKAEVTHIEGKDLHAQMRAQIKAKLEAAPIDGSFAAVNKDEIDAVLQAFDKQAETVMKAAKDKKFTTEQVEELATKFHDSHVRTSIGKSAEEIEAAMKQGIKVIEEAKGIAAETANAAEKAGFFARNFSTDVKRNWENSSKGIRFARGAGVTVGAALVTMGGKDIISKDEEGNRHVVSGIMKTGAGAAAIAASLLAKGKGASASV